MPVCGNTVGSDRPATGVLMAERSEWCGQHNLKGAADCDVHFAALEQRFAAAWNEERSTTLGNLPRLDLSGRDLRLANAPGVALVAANLGRARLEGASLRGARMEGADLSEARLEETSLWQARMEGADLRDARLEGADLAEARLEGANLMMAQLQRASLIEARLERALLHDARLDGANLWGARLERADLSSALLKGADLWGAWLERADLSGASLEQADLRGARGESADLTSVRLEGANLVYADFRSSSWAGTSLGGSASHVADLRGARQLTQAQLEALVGNAEALLPDGPAPDTGKAFYIWSCWETPPFDLDRVVAVAAGLRATDANRAAVRARLLCGPDNPRRKTGTPLALDAPYPDGHPLANRG